MTIRFSATLAALALVSACGGAETGGDTKGARSFAALTKTAGTAFGTFEASSDTRRLGYGTPSGRGFQTGVSRDDRLDQRVFDGYRNSDHILFRAEAPDGSGAVEVFAIADDRTDNQIAPGARALSNGGSLPASGAATYAGEYVGFLTRDTTTSNPNLTQSYIVGNVALSADFDDATLSGVIRDRQRYLTSNNAPAGAMANVTLGQVDLTNGGSAGNGQTFGGRLPTDRYKPAAGQLSGEWNAALGGNGATTVGGTVTITHDYLNNGSARTPDDYVETGGFAAARN